MGRHMWIARHAHCRPAAAAPLPTTSGLRPPTPTDSPSRPPARRADALQEALGKCIIGYTPDVFLQPSQTICLPTWYDACRYVSISGEPTRPAARRCSLVGVGVAHMEASCLLGVGAARGQH